VVLRLTKTRTNNIHYGINSAQFIIYKHVIVALYRSIESLLRFVVSNKVETNNIRYSIVIVRLQVSVSSRLRRHGLS